MNSPFRSVPFWQSALMTLPDAAFFDLMRSVLGTVKTPFNKHTLVQELSHLIIRPEIQENIAAYIDNNDRRIIAAIALLSEPVPGELESFFTGEFSYVELQGMLLNLEERLIIYRFRDNNVLRIALNPRLENILAPYAANKGILFPSIEISSPENDTTKDGAVQNCTFDNRTLAALFIFLLNNEVQLKDDGKGLSFVFRKKAAEQGKILFPGLDTDSLAGGLLALGLLCMEGQELIPDEAEIAAFKTIPNLGRYEYLAGGIAIFLHRGCIANDSSRSFARNDLKIYGVNSIGEIFSSRGFLKSIVRLIRNFGDVAKDRKMLPEVTMIKLAELFRRQEAASWSLAILDGLAELPSAAVLLRSLVVAGLFSIVVINGKNCYCPSYLYSIDSDTDKLLPGRGLLTGQPCIAMDSGFSCILYPEISFADVMDLAAFSSVEETGTTVRFVLSRDSVIRGFDRGYNADFLWQLLGRLSCDRTPDALKWNLDDWERRWKEVSLNQGVVLSLSGDRSYLAQTEPIASIIKQSLSPGVYLLSAGIDEAAAALRCSGVDIVGRPKTRIRPESIEEPVHILEKSAEKPVENYTKIPIEESNENTTERIEQIKKQFRIVLDTMKLTKQEREELESRIDRRMIVSETQLKDTSLRYEKLEARSLDYVGKTGIVKQAILSGSILELSCLNGEKILGFPESLDKKGGEMILFIKPRDGGEPVKIALGKISVIRRIKQSIFGV